MTVKHIKDNSRQFIPVNFCVITMSDSRTIKTDKSGDSLISKIKEAGHILVERQIVPDDINKISRKMSTKLTLYKNSFKSQFAITFG